MEPTNDTKMQLQLMGMVVLMSVGIAFCGQWVFNKCFKMEEVGVEKSQPKVECDTTKNKDTLYMYNITKQNKR